MSEIKFSCPNCQQSIQAPPEYAGMQINCPSCQTVMVVPQADEAVPSAAKGKLSKAPSTVQHSTTSPTQAATIIRKGKKPPYALYAKLGVGALVIAAGIFFGPQLFEKYQQHRTAAAAAEFAATNVPPPPPPEPSANEIVSKVGAAYKAFPSYSVEGESVANMDMSQVNPMMTAPVQTKAKFSMLLGRPSHYRIEWERDAGPKTMKGSAWSAGKGDFVQTGTTPIRMKGREMALNAAAGYSGTLGVYLAASFFDQTNSLDAALKNFSKGNNETLNGQKCYVLSGQIGPQKMMFWIHKDDFLIAQAEVTFGGKIDDSALAGLNAAQKKQMQAFSKIKGNIIETYINIETNRDLKAGDFQVALAGTAHAKSKRAEDPAVAGRPKREKPQ